MVKSDEGNAAKERDQKTDRLIDLLGEVSAISKALKLELLDFIVGMAILEVSEQTRMAEQTRP